MFRKHTYCLNHAYVHKLKLVVRFFKANRFESDLINLNEFTFGIG